MASHRRPKQPSRARLTLFGATAAATVAVTSQGAQADPNPTMEEVQERVDELHHEAEEATEEYNGAKEQEEELEEEIADLQDAAARGQGELNDLVGSLGSIASAQYRNGGLDPSVQLFLSSDPEGYLDRASTLDQVSGVQAETLRQIESQQRTLEQQREEAAEKLEDLEELREELRERKDEIQGRLAEAQELLNQLTEEEQAALDAAAAEEASDAAEAAAGASLEGASSYGAAAVAAAETALGTPYVWGGSSPGGFDCSGLTSWAYAQAGVSLPRTSQSQAYAGTQVGINDLAPGDLVFFYSELSHVGIYVGNGQMIHAPRPGGVVEYSSLDVMPFAWGVRVG
ncbi:NlpC/P60 family protein [Streptomyces sp. 4N509B]|uniref:NlpC/P60 family protein n=1 Tax=Streptomyces sp. 4N509B TaxID=3457413 RepID=UPI003FD6708C